VELTAIFQNPWLDFGDGKGVEGRAGKEASFPPTARVNNFENRSIFGKDIDTS